MSSVCIITARGGSKRIPRKNVREFCGKPIIAYSIEAALKSRLFDEVMVSTDDEEIAEVARAYGAEVPFMRSEATSNDFATTGDVLDEVLSKYEKQGKTFETMCCLYPTAPFVTEAELSDAFRLMAATSSDSVFAVTDFDFCPQRAFLVGENGVLSWERPEFAATRSQDLPETAHDCGRFYFIKTSVWVERHSFVTPNCRGFHIDPALVQDIDTMSDWHLAEIKFNAWKEGGC